MEKKTRRKGSAQRKGVMRLPLLVLTHVLVLGIALLIYAYPHHVAKREMTAQGTTTSRTMSSHSQVSAPTATATIAPATAAPLAQENVPDIAEQSATIAPTEVPTPAPTDAVGSFKIKFAEYFSDGEVTITDDSYKSANINATFTKTVSEKHKLRFFMVDFYIADISCFGTVMAEDTFGRNYLEWPESVAKRTKSLVTINGDYYGARETGVVVRNGVLYECTKSPRDVCVLYWDGVMKTFAPDEFDAQKEIEQNGAYHTWNFGPRLLDDDGEPLKDFNSNYPYVSVRAPRTVLGYFEPGHYCFVVVDGRSSTTQGVNLDELAALLKTLGCKQAFNLDGGGTTMLYKGTKLINKPYKGGRKCSDFVVLREPVQESGGN